MLTRKRLDDDYWAGVASVEGGVEGWEAADYEAHSVEPVRGYDG
jgi:hypothetical protein